MPSQDDLLFGSLCASMKFARPEMVTECLKVQADEEGTGQRRGLGEIMISRGYLTSEQLAQVLEAQGRSGRARTMGPYELTGKLGQGGMGTVFKARLRGTQIDVALKILPDRMVLNESFLVRFKREATLGKELLHPNIVRTLDFGNDRGVNYIALELVEGGDLDARLKKAGKLPERDALGVVRDVAKGLMHAHERGLIHRDIKPSNIMFDRAGTVKLSDFGLVKDTNPEASSLTQTGAMMGTPYYLAPEQAQGAKDLDIRADIYSLGATLYHCTTGRPPHEGETPYEVVVKHITEALTPPDQVNPALSAGCCRIIKKMMAKDKLHRHASPAEVVEDIERHLRGLQVAEARHAVTARPPAQGKDARPARKPEREARAKKDGPPMIFLGAAAGVLLLGLLGFVLLRGNRPPAAADAPPRKSETRTPPAPPAVPAAPVAPAPVPVPVAPAPPAGTADWTDLLRGIDAERDAVAGRWHNDKEGLSCEVPPVWNSSVIELRPPPAEEYDFRAEFTVNRHPRDGWGRGEVCLIFNAEGKHARFALWSLDFYHIGFVWDRRHFVVMNATASNNVTMARQPAQLEQLRTYTAHIEVRKDLVKGYLDGKLITEWRPNDFTENDMASFVLRDRQKLGVGAYQSQVRFTRLDVRPATR